MFYSQLLLSKKGPLGVVWQAAHLDRKMTRATIASTNIKEAAGALIGLRLGLGGAPTRGKRRYAPHPF